MSKSGIAVLVVAVIILASLLLLQWFDMGSFGAEVCDAFT